MRSWSRRGLGLRHLAIVLLAGGLGASGCGSKTAPEGSPAAEETSRAAQVSPERPAAAARPAAPGRDRLHQAFADATLGPDNPPPDSKPPADRTVTGKSGPRLFEQVRDTWDRVVFVSKSGKKVRYTAEVVTACGTIEIELLPELSPNHVRNFIVLARLGYYDGLCFDRIHTEVGDGARLCQIEAGCPLGTGETAAGSIGYWMKDEFTHSEKLSHEVGVVGACRTLEPDSAATRFYINLEKAPYLDSTDTLFGKVVLGLDVARTIALGPVASALEDGPRARPRKPVVIDKVTIREHETEAVEK